LAISSVLLALRLEHFVYASQIPGNVASGTSGEERRDWPAYGGAPVDIRPRYSEDRRWAPGRRVDPDVAPWRGRQQ